MLVAIARGIIDLSERKFSHLSILKLSLDSLIKLTPIKNNKKNDIQWSSDFILFSNKAPKEYPAKGITAWKLPKYNPITRGCINLMFLTQIPLHTDTAKASIDNPTDIKIISTKDTQSPVFC